MATRWSRWSELCEDPRDPNVGRGDPRDLVGLRMRLTRSRGSAAGGLAPRPAWDRVSRLGRGRPCTSTSVGPGLEARPRTALHLDQRGAGSRGSAADGLAPRPAWDRVSRLGRGRPRSSTSVVRGLEARPRAALHLDQRGTGSRGSAAGGLAPRPAWCGVSRLGRGRPCTSTSVGPGLEARPRAALLLDQRGGRPCTSTNVKGAAPVIRCGPLRQVVQCSAVGLLAVVGGLALAGATLAGALAHGDSLTVVSQPTGTEYRRSF
ncbi:hypothetical protein SAMN06296429_10124 [Janibacter indicus]|uniref:Uncharacterized protein n=1 Tax=Janibacter indicus TaxID=857417 RepID=A0A1W1Y4Z0_9MICO|nr:hypothetical protein SAMN06296429_10124 [Janibacter indicus]